MAKLLLRACRSDTQFAIIVPVSRGGAAWSARLAHNQEVAGSNPAPATKRKAQLLVELFSWLNDWFKLIC